MTQYLPLFIGVLTVCLFSFLTNLFYAEGRTIWTAFFGILTAIRVFELGRQARRLFTSDDD